MAHNLLRVTDLALAALLALMSWLTPNLTRPDLYFAVTVRPEFRHSVAGLALLRRYRAGVAVIAALALTAIAMYPQSAFRWMPLTLLAQVAASFLVFYRARAQVRPHAVAPTSIREAAAFQRRGGIPGGWLAACGPFVLLAAVAVYLWLHWQQIPARFPTHFGPDGTADRWATRSWGIIFLAPLIVAAVLIPLTLLRYGMSHWARPIQPGGGAGAQESRFRSTSSISLLAIEYAIALQASWIALRPLIAGVRSLGAAEPIVLLLPLPVAIILVAVLARLGQGGSRLVSATERVPDSSQPIGDRTADRYWRLGVFYVNREDPAVVVEKRFGLGYTLNLGRPTSWTIMLIVLLVPLTVVLVRLLR